MEVMVDMEGTAPAMAIVAVAAVVVVQVAMRMHILDHTLIRRGHHAAPPSRVPRRQA